MKWDKMEPLGALAMFQGLDSHMWLVDVMLDSTGLEVLTVKDAWLIKVGKWTITLKTYLILT